MRQLSIILLFIFSPAVTFAASAVLLVNPPTLYFSKPDAVSLKQVEDIIVDAVDRSSSLQIIWTIENKTPNALVAKIVVRNKHTAFVNISYNQKKISVKYKDSRNLKYEKINSRVGKIHPNYLTWVNYLVQKIKFSTEKHTQYSLVETDPAPQTIAKGKGKQHFVIAAQAEPGKRDDDYELSYTMEKFSASLLKSMAKSIANTKNDSVTFETIAWGDTIKNLLKESRKKEVNKNLCATYKADKILYADAPRMPGGQGSRDIMYYLYICSSNRKIKETYEIDRNDLDTYGYQIALIGSTKDFIEYSNAYK